MPAIDMLVRAEETVVVPATAGQLDAIHAALDRFWAKADTAVTRSPDGEWRARFVTAAGEIAANIVRHAHPPGRPPGPMRLVLRAYPDRVEACFNDQGLAYGFPPPSEGPPEEGSPESDPLELSESGRGLAIARAFLDELEYRHTEEGTNEWRLMKRF